MPTGSIGTVVGKMPARGSPKPNVNTSPKPNNDTTASPKKGAKKGVKKGAKKGVAKKKKTNETPKGDSPFLLSSARVMRHMKKYTGMLGSSSGKTGRARIGKMAKLAMTGILEFIMSDIMQHMHYVRMVRSKLIMPSPIDKSILGINETSPELEAIAKEKSSKSLVPKRYEPSDVYIALDKYKDLFRGGERVVMNSCSLPYKASTPYTARRGSKQKKTKAASSSEVPEVVKAKASK